MDISKNTQGVLRSLYYSIGLQEEIKSTILTKIYVFDDLHLLLVYSIPCYKLSSSMHIVA